ncbi:MAG: aldehyde dehydrogenase [Chloroflexi bacterium HGW-Chloroflexi-10]|nr:MAG: aldehyde dehydrogenase [Chloroflexi bacterium HGW-Chloroflexi-10]
MEDTIRTIVEKARAAQKVIEFWPQERVDEMVAAVGWQLYQLSHAEACARSAVSETGMGVYEDKVLKHQKKTMGVLRDLHGLQTVGVIETDEIRGLIKVAKPVGVIGALTPVTNASSTLSSNGLPILKTRNAVIFSPHPKAKATCELTCNYMRAGLQQVGAPLDLIQNILEPSVAMTQELMKQVDLVVATGGSAMVKVAYSSGTPAYGVGAGNAVVIIDETADLSDAAHKIFLGKTFDNATSCSAENSVVLHESIFNTMLGFFQEHGGYLCDAIEKARLKEVMWPDGIHLSAHIVGQSAAKIADLAAIKSKREIKFLMVQGEAVGPEDMFSAEKLSPVLTLWRYQDFEEAIKLVADITRFSGYGHSCGIHSQDEAHITALAMHARVSRIMVNQVQTFGNSGNFDNGMPVALTLGCGTWGGNIVSENVHWKHFLNTTWVSRAIAPRIPDEAVIFGDHWNKFGH